MRLVYGRVTWTEVYLVLCILTPVPSCPYLGSIWTEGSRDSFGSLKTGWTEFSSFSWNSTLSLWFMDETLSVLRFDRSSLNEMQSHCSTDTTEMCWMDRTLGPICPTAPNSPGIPWKDTTQTFEPLLYIQRQYISSSINLISVDINSRWRVVNYGGTVRFTNK